MTEPFTVQYKGFLDAVPLRGAEPPPPAPSASPEIAALQAQVRELRDREEIRQLMIDYGRMLDMRDFAAFGRLFAHDAEYVAGTGAATVGPEAIGNSLAHIYSISKTPEPKFHVFFNEIIHVAGDVATATSMSFFFSIDADRRPRPTVMATYDDHYVREDGRWRFKRRAVQGIIPAPGVP